jgi:hypothetical protein
MNIFTSSMSWHLAIAISLLFSLLLSFLVSFFFESNIQQVFSAPKKSGLRIIPKVSSVDFRASARLARIWDPVGQTFKASARSEVEISLAVPFFFSFQGAEASKHTGGLDGFRVEGAWEYQECNTVLATSRSGWVGRGVDSVSGEPWRVSLLVDARRRPAGGRGCSQRQTCV